MAPLSLAQTGSPHLSGEFRADRAFPEFMPMWREGWSWKDENGDRVRYAYEGMPLGGYLFAYFQNTGTDPLSVTDVLLDGVSLAKGVAPEDTPKTTPDDKYPSSIKFSKLASSQIEKLVTAGEPVWWKVEPLVIAPGGYGQLTVRLRRDPKIESVEITIPSLPEADRKFTIPVSQRQPWFASINFAPGFDAVFAYLRHPSGKGIAPQRILLDGRDVTNQCTITSDAVIDTVPVVIKPDAPFKPGSWHMFQADYADKTRAMVVIGAWQPGFVYGMWGYSKVGKTSDENRKFFLEDMRVHNINTLMYSIPGEVRAFLRTTEGQAYSRQSGIRIMTNWVGDAVEPPFLFLTDEPDAADFMSRMLEPGKRIGSLGQWLVRRADMFRRGEPDTPILLNVDNTFKPENWYTYAQLADLPCADPYYQEALRGVYQSDPTNLSAYLKPTYVYGVGTIYQSAGAPKPMHLILHTCRFDVKESPFRGPTPEEKRIEVYYALAAGAKALSYWWYTPFGEYYGCGGGDKEMKALWKELGLLGAEIRSAESVLIRSCPAKLQIEGSRMLWIRSLLAGNDAVALIIANDNVASDRVGTVIRPVENAHVRAHLPAWLKAADVFEVTYRGPRDVKWQVGADGLNLELGTVHVTRFIVVSNGPGLRHQVQQAYDDKYAANVAALAPDESGH